MNNRFSKNILIVVTIICAFLILISTMQNSFLNPIRKYAGLVLTPVQSGISSFGSTIASSIDENRHLHSAYKENEELKTRLAELSEENY